MKRAAGVIIAIVGGVVGIIAGFGAGVVEGFLVPLRLGGTRVPVAVAIAIVANIGIALWTRYVTGNRLAPLAPAVAWFAAIALLGTRTAAGDLVIVGDDWVALLTVFVGAIAFAVAIFLGARPAADPQGQQSAKPAVKSGRTPDLR